MIVYLKIRPIYLKIFQDDLDYKLHERPKGGADVFLNRQVELFCASGATLCKIEFDN